MRLPRQRPPLRLLRAGGAEALPRLVDAARCCCTPTTGTPRSRRCTSAPRTPHRPAGAAGRAPCCRSTIRATRATSPPEMMPEVGLPVGALQLASARVVREGQLPQGRARLRRHRHHGEPDPRARSCARRRRLRAAGNVHLAGRPGSSASSTASTSAVGSRPPTRRSPRPTRPTTSSGKRTLQGRAAALVRAAAAAAHPAVRHDRPPGAQKGLDLILASRSPARVDAQFVFLGGGEQRYEQAAARAAPRRSRTESASSSTSPTGWSTG